MSEPDFLFTVKMNILLLNVIVAVCAKVSGREKARMGSLPQVRGETRQADEKGSEQNREDESVLDIPNLPNRGGGIPKW